MPPAPVLGWRRLALIAAVLLAVLALLLRPSWWRPGGPPRIDAGDLAAAPGDATDEEVVVTGEWVSVLAVPPGYMTVMVRGKGGRRIICHFEDVPVTDWGWLGERLREADRVAISGRRGGVEDGYAVLKGCRLLE